MMLFKLKLSTRWRIYSIAIQVLFYGSCLSQIAPSRQA